MKFWLLPLVWALCLASIACGAPLVESGTPAISSSAGNRASLGAMLASGTFPPKDKGHTVMPQAMVETLKSYTENHIHDVDSPSVFNITESSNLTAAVGDVSIVSADPKISLQILLFEQDGRHSWYMYQGPYGIAVNPCTGDGFKTLVVGYDEDRQLDFNNPPYVSAGAKWDVDIGYCSYESRADNPGYLVCFGKEMVQFTKDAGNNEKGTIHCWKNSGLKTVHWWFHRAWVLEY